jgi:two-component system, chemotaxis family, protein-glutamate methylesterase/glutaminase
MGESMPRKPRVRVVITDDSALARELLSQLLASDPEIEVVGVARGGQEAVELVERLRPDIVTMDLRMPGTDGLAATAEITRRVPTPVIIVTSSDFRLRTKDIFDSFRFGVVDVVEKPALTPDGVHSLAARILLDKVKTLSRIRVAGGMREAVVRRATPPLGLPVVPPRRRVIGIGASTGGPRALPEVLGRLPSDLPVPVLIVQHMSKSFVDAFVEWLATESRLPVAVAQDGDTPQPGHVLVAPGGVNMVLDNAGRVRLNDDTAPAGIKPSVDFLLTSLARVHGAGAVGVVLTGIGKDGTEGLRSIRKAGGVTLVQDYASCVVSGMPSSAVNERVVDEVVALQSMATALLRVIGHAAPLEPSPEPRPQDARQAAAAGSSPGVQQGRGTRRER